MVMKQEKANQISSLMQLLIPNHGDKIIFSGRIYPQHHSHTMYWFIDGEECFYKFGETLPKELDLIMDVLIQELHYEHFEITGYKSSEVDIKTRHIPEEDSWPGLHMRRVSELTEAELEDYYIPREDWEERKALAEMPDSERITILLGDELNAHIEGEQGVQLSVDFTDEVNPTVKLTRLLTDGNTKDIELHHLTTAWLIKQSTELRASPPYNQSPWAK